ncbi:MAG: preprotein translocase subunit YajC [SAR86 cluster bacterium]|jgi:preprotein translocase subunit YajC|uniref:Sec translocon accessory complex subunit YajC n=1 Tax=SAR86 cluster bacterium TaxID=2030880 RepID=A0A520MX56_9GAMM|nr:MAG: preprotein translocase subunit YajC [SAR86 cluster bacterium]|tara:strand:+ start:692 stop:988 length:297 start_codon:yes stop_codon:yes gene_type:complete
MEGATSSLLSPLLFLGFLLLFMYIVIIRPQNKRNKEINAMLSSLDVGAEVIAASGIIGKVKAIKGEYISLEVSESVVFKLQKSAIANVLPKGTIESIK